MDMQKVSTLGQEFERQIQTLVGQDVKAFFLKGLQKQIQIRPQLK